MGKLNRLSARTVATLKEPGYYPDGGGLYLQVSRSGTKSWVFRYTTAGKTRDMGLGPLASISLLEAREAAIKCRALRQEGKDPISHRNSLKAATEAVPTFKAAATVYIDDHRQAWSDPKHIAQWENTLETYAYPFIGEKRVDAVNIVDALAILRPIWGVKQETATRVRQRCETVLDAEAAKGHREGENPFRWKGRLDKLLPKPGVVKKVQHFPALPYSELPGFMVELRLEQGVSARALEWTILTVARTRMTIGARSSEIHGDLWKVPGARMKSRRPHEIPLSSYAMEIREGLEGDYLFPGWSRGHLSNGAMLQLLERMGYGHVTVHGFRSTFKDWCAEQTNFPNEVSEAALAHVVEDKTEAAYRRGALLEKRRKLMEAWGRYCKG